MSSLFQQSKLLLGLALPLMVGQVAQTGMGVVDTMMAGSVSKDDLAGVALGSAVWLPLFLFMSGVLLAITPKVAQVVGSDNKESLQHILQQGIWLAVILTMLSLLMLVGLIEFFLPVLKLEQAVLGVSQGYLWMLAIGVLPALLFQVLRFFHEGHGHTAITMKLSLLAFLLNIPFNYFFIEVAGLGGIGCGLATSLVYVLLLFGAWWFYRQHADYEVVRAKWQWHIADTALIYSLLKVGLPIAGAILFEVGLFTFIAFLVTPLGTTVLAAHQIAISYTSFVFMFPLSLAMALTIQVGNYRGQGSPLLVRQSIKAGYLLAILLGSSISLLTLWLSDVVAGIYSRDADVVAIAAHLLWLAALYQLSDAIQVISAGALRGIEETSVVMRITFVAYWLVGLPLGYWLCYGSLTEDTTVWLGIDGFWLSFTVGLSVAAIGLLWQVRRRLFMVNSF